MPSRTAYCRTMYSLLWRCRNLIQSFFWDFIRYFYYISTAYYTNILAHSSLRCYAMLSMMWCGRSLASPALHAMLATLCCSSLFPFRSVIRIFVTSHFLYLLQLRESPWKDESCNRCQQRPAPILGSCPCVPMFNSWNAPSTSDTTGEASRDEGERRKDGSDGMLKLSFIRNALCVLCW